MANPSQLLLLADHIKLSLLERQRAISLDLEPNAQDGNISRSLESMREGVEGVEQEVARLQSKGDPYASSDHHEIQDWISPLTSIDRSATSLRDQAKRLRDQYNDLTGQFNGFPASTSSISQPNDPSLAADFAHASDIHPHSSLKSTSSPAHTPNKSVRFRDNDSDEDEARAQLLPYRDEPPPPDQSQLSNQQIHEYHSQVLEEQDEQLDRLGESIGRQRDLSIQIGNELDEHVTMLDEVDRDVDRHQGRLDGARHRIGQIARKANDNKQITTIVILIIILVLLIIILK